MRGTLPSFFFHGSDDRFIPAHAGNTSRSANEYPRWLVHPRSCGEHIPNSRMMCINFGSSPLMRGTQNTAQGRVVVNRFIPAHAGNTTEVWRLQCHVTVHPRSCGEHEFSHRERLPIYGSSPLMRGTQS